MTPRAPKIQFEMCRRRQVYPARSLSSDQVHKTESAIARWFKPGHASVKNDGRKRSAAAPGEPKNQGIVNSGMAGFEEYCCAFDHNAHSGEGDLARRIQLRMMF